MSSFDGRGDPLSWSQTRLRRARCPSLAIPISSAHRAWRVDLVGLRAQLHPSGPTSTADRRAVATARSLENVIRALQARCNAVSARKETAWPASRQDGPTEHHKTSNEAAIRQLRIVPQLEQGVSEEGRSLSSVRNNSCRASAGPDVSRRPPSVAWGMLRSTVVPMSMPCRKVGPSPEPSRPR